MNTSSSAFAPFIGGPGLQISISPGSALIGGTTTVVPLTVVQLAANATTFVYIQAQPAPIIASSTVASNGIPICTVVTNATGVVSLTDTRPDIIGSVVPANAGTTVITEDAVHDWYNIVRTDNTFGGVLRFLNSSVSGYPNPNQFHEISVNVDGQVNYTTFNLGVGLPNNKSAEMDLDEDGHFSIAAGNGGGISTDPNTGNTCIPYPITGGGPFANSFQISVSGVVAKYLGQATSGNGISTILGFTNSTGLSGNIGPVTLFTTNASGYASLGLYRVDGYFVAASNVGGATFQATVNYTDRVGANSQTTGAIAFATTGAKVPFSFVIEAVASSAITITLTTAHTNYNGQTRTTTI